MASRQSVLTALSRLSAFSSIRLFAFALLVLVAMPANAAPPTITIAGDNPAQVIEGATYTDAGATANDPEEGDLTPIMNTTSNVNTAIPGPYTVVYDVTDAEANFVSATRNVTVLANDAPTITILGNNPESVLEGATYSDAGATAADTEDGNLTGSIGVTNNVNTGTPGAYTVVYSVTDSGGKTTTATRNVTVTANAAPTITILGNNPESVAEGSTYNDAGATAADAEDGNLTGSIGVTNNVNTGTAGNYTVVYSVTDSGGKTTTATRNVTVTANAAPTITILGNNPESVAEGSTYNDAGATAADAEDGNLTGSIGVTNNVNTGTAGNYTVVYSVTDSGGLTTTATRNVTVTANAAPTITILGSNPASVVEGSTYNDAGATAADAEDGNLTGSIGVTNNVNTGTAGNYTVVYSVTDSGGLTTTATRNVTVTANASPTITILGSNPASVLQGSTYNDAGATAADAEDGNLTSSISVTNNVNTGTAGNYTVVYSVTDSGGKTTTATRNVTVGSNTSPTITILGSNPATVLQGSTYNDAGATAADAEDGNLTSSINVTNNVNTGTAGNYTVVYSVTDSNGNTTTATRNVTVGSNTSPTITILGSNPATVLQGSTYNDAGATAADAEDGNLTSSINVTNNVNTGTAGNYTVVYSVTDSNGNNTTATRNVTVGTNSSPVITILGSNPDSVLEGSTYNDAGATATDAEDGNLTGSINVTNNVNTATPGDYTVVYSVTDSDGNNTSATRNVTVGANAAPVITITGDNPASVAEGAIYTDAGATATDAEDGDLTASISVTDNVNTAIPGNYTVVYSVTDSGGKTGTATRNVTVAANEAPVITAQIALSTIEDTALPLDISMFTVNDADTPAGDLLLIVQDGANYTHAGNIVTPALDFTGNLIVNVVANDRITDGPVFNATVDVTPVNDPPVIVGQVPLTTPEDMSLTILVTDLVINDPDNLPGDFTLTLAAGLNYSLLGNTVTPDPNFSGTLSVGATVSDGEFTSPPANLVVTVEAINDDPLLDIEVLDQVAVENAPFNLNISGNFSDADGDILTYTATGLPPSGNIVFNGNTGVFSGTPRIADARDNDPYVILVTATDRFAGSVDAVDQFDLNVSALERANVSLDIVVSPNPALVNDQLQWTFTARNTVGPQAATNVILRGSFVGNGLTVSSTSGCTISVPAGQVTNFSCTIGDLVVGDFTSALLTTTTGAAGEVTAFATAQGANPVPIDPNLDDNSNQVAVGVVQVFSNGAVQVLGTAGIRSVAVGDVDGDLAPDLVAGTAAGQPVQVYLSGGFRDFAMAPISIPDLASNEGIALADFNGDGNLDIAVANADGQPDRVYRGDGAGNFATMATLSSSAGNGVAVGDFNNDGNMDVAIAAAGGNPIYHGNGNGGFSLQGNRGNADSRAVAAADFNGDGRDDVVFANVGSASLVWDGGRNIFMAQLIIGDAVAVTTGQFGGSAQPDLAFGRVPTGIGDVSANPVFISTNGNFGSPVARLGTAPTYDIDAGDINNDGLTDLVFINSSGVHQIWYANGAGSFFLHSEQIVADDAVAGAVAEFGFTDVGDPGGADLAMGGFPQPGLGVFLNDGFGNLGRGDAVPPEILLVGEAVVEVPSGSVYADEGATALDNIDGDITGAILVTDTVNTAVVGAYLVTYDVSDFAGNAAIPITRTVNVTPASGTGGGGGGSLASWTLLLLGLLVLALQDRPRRAVLASLPRRRNRRSQGRK